MIEVLNSAWTDDTKNWNSINWSLDAINFIARMSAAVFVGSDLARTSEWQALITSYTTNLFFAARALRSWPKPLRFVVHWFLPACRKCRAQVSTARGMILKELARRQETGENKYDDSIKWMEDIASGRPYDPAAAQLGLAISAIHTTSELLKQTLLDICMQPDFIQPLRKEICTAVERSGWTIAGLAEMRLLDSVIKESQRLKPGMLINLERMATSEVTMPDGTILPKGTQLAVTSSGMWSSTSYTNPGRHDGYRFLAVDSNVGAAQLVSSSPSHFAFGMGRSICPGRFCVASEIKIALANILLKYDVRLAEGQKPEVTCIGFEMMADPNAKLQVRKREEE